jgi:hypothetical protein
MRERKTEIDKERGGGGERKERGFKFEEYKANDKTFR